jgi:hypothetical protein
MSFTHSTGDKLQHYNSLRRLLLRIHYNAHIDQHALLTTAPFVEQLQPILRHALCNLSQLLTHHLIVTHSYEFHSTQTPQRFLFHLYRLLRSGHLQYEIYTPTLNQQQLLQNGFVERKLQFCCDIIRMAMRKHNDLVREQQQQQLSASVGSAIDINRRSSSKKKRRELQEARQRLYHSATSAHKQHHQSDDKNRHIHSLAMSSRSATSALSSSKRSQSASTKKQQASSTKRKLLTLSDSIHAGLSQSLRIQQQQQYEKNVAKQQEELSQLTNGTTIAASPASAPQLQTNHVQKSLFRSTPLSKLKQQQQQQFNDDSDGSEDQQQPVTATVIASPLKARTHQQDAYDDAYQRSPQSHARPQSPSSPFNLNHQQSSLQQPHILTTNDISAPPSDDDQLDTSDDEPRDALSLLNSKLREISRRTKHLTNSTYKLQQNFHSKRVVDESQKFELNNHDFTPVPPTVKRSTQQQQQQQQQQSLETPLFQQPAQKSQALTVHHEKNNASEDQQDNNNVLSAFNTRLTLVEGALRFVSSKLLQLEAKHNANDQNVSQAIAVTNQTLERNKLIQQQLNDSIRNASIQQQEMNQHSPMMQSADTSAAITQREVSPELMNAMQQQQQQQQSKHHQTHDSSTQTRSKSSHNRSSPKSQQQSRQSKIKENPYESLIEPTKRYEAEQRQRQADEAATAAAAQLAIEKVKSTAADQLQQHYLNQAMQPYSSPLTAPTSNFLAAQPMRQYDSQSVAAQIAQTNQFIEQAKQRMAEVRLNIERQRQSL